VAANTRTLWGWHQLDSSWARLLVAEAGICAGDLVLDVGAGSGALTVALTSVGAKVIAVEMHPGRAAQLRARCASQAVTVVQADATDLRLPRRPFRVVANPPFATLKPLLRRLLAPGSRLVSADLLVPGHVAREWTGPGAPGRQRWAREITVSRGRSVPRLAFYPPPPRNAVVLRVRRTQVSARPMQRLDHRET
jgi:23S rRNA (adenine-N6)-dimethyltransferase